MTAQRLSLMTLALFAAYPAMAQDAPAAPPSEEKINTVIVYGEDECAASSDDVINVCARMPEADRFRIPESLRDDPNDARKEAWGKRVMAYEYVGASGAMSCSPSGSAGFTGCGLKEIDAAYAEKKSDPGLAFGRMIAAERKKRLAMIDAEAELVEERAKLFEQERAARDAKLEATADQAVEEQAGSLPLPQ